MRDAVGGQRPDLSRWPWLQQLLETSEASACLSLCGNHASTLTAEAIGTTVECRVRCQDGFPLGPTLVFEAVCVFGDDAGRAIAFRPLHDPSRLVVAFRGVRVEREALKSHAAQPVRSRNRSMGSAVTDRGIDIKNMLGTQSASADWLPALGMRVHDGIMRHHDSFWTSRHCSRNERKSLGSAAAAGGEDAGEGVAYLGAWLAGQTYASEVLFVGLSLGAALAQISALRAAAELPQLRERLHVLALGTVQWADAATARYYAEVFGDRAVQLVNTARSSGPAPLHAGWWVPEPPGCAAEGRDGDGDGDGERYVVVDPLTAELAPQFSLLHNTIPCRVPQPDSSDLAAFDMGFAPHIGSATAQLGTLSALMRGTLNSQHPMSYDYQRLHLGRNYRSTLRDLFIRLRRDSVIQATYPLAGEDCDAMAISPRQSPRLSPRVGAAPFEGLLPRITRSASLKRSLGALGTLPGLHLPPPEPKRRAGEGLRSIQSYPSRLSDAVGAEEPEGGGLFASRVRSYASLEALAASAAAAIADLEPWWAKRGREAVSQAVVAATEIAMF